MRVPLGPCPSRGRIILNAEHGISLSAHYRKLIWQGKLPRGGRPPLSIVRTSIYGRMRMYWTVIREWSQSERFAQC